MQIVELATTRKGRDSSSSNKLRRVNEPIVTVNMTSFEQIMTMQTASCTGKTIQTTNGAAQEQQW